MKRRPGYVVPILAIVAALALAVVVRLGRARRLANVADADASDGFSPLLATYDEMSFVTLRSLDEARTMEHTAVIVRGYARTAGTSVGIEPAVDGDALVYLTVPVKAVACDETALRAAFASLAQHAHDEGRRMRLTFELAPIGSGILGADGGGEIADGLWLHPSLAATNFFIRCDALLRAGQ